jgi:tetratricopeptide (TPR) repeat protein
MAERLEDLLRSCSVRVTGARAAGAGFFVAPGLVITCEHVIAGGEPVTVRWERDRRPPIEVRAAGPPLVVTGRGRPIPALESDYPDIAVLQVEGIAGHPCVLLEEGWPEPGDEFQIFGYPAEGGAALLTPAMLSYRGLHGTVPMVFADLGSDTIKPGMSGAGLLNLSTGAVCGIVTASKHPERPDGALAIPWGEIATDLAEVAAANRAFHSTDGRWDAARKASAVGPSRSRGIVVARSGAALGGLAAATRTLPRDVASFTGRERELDSLAEAAQLSAARGTVVSIHAIGGMAGIGKTAFAVRAAHLFATTFPDGQIFLPLHGHTPGQRPVDPADALASLLQTTGMAAKEIPGDFDARVRMWRDYLAGKRLLIVLDDAIGHSQVSPLLPGTAGSMVLITSRRHLTALTDAQVINLDVLSPRDADQLFVRIASRPDTLSDDPAVTQLTSACGYLPLAIGLLAGQLRHHPSWTAKDLMDDLAAARNRLELIRAENVSVRAALDLSYQDLTDNQKLLFCRIGMHPGADIDAYAAAALDDIDVPTAHRQLEALYDQYLLIQPTRGRYRAHDLVREYARSLAAAETTAESGAAARRLVGYYLHATRRADAHLARRKTAGVPNVQVEPPAHSPEIATRQAAAAWMGKEIPNIFAVAEFAAANGWLDVTIGLSAAVHGFLRGQGQIDQALAFQRAALLASRDLNDPLAEASALTDSGDFQRLFGNPARAAELLLQAVDRYRLAGVDLGEANALDELAAAQVRLGDYAGAAANLTRALSLYRELGDKRGEAHALNHQGAMQDVIGDYQGALASQEKALELYSEVGYVLGAANAANELGYVQRLTGDYRGAAASQARAIELAQAVGFLSGEADALSELGAVQVATGDLAAAASTLEKAARRCQETGYRRGEAAALTSLGPVQHIIGEHEQAKASLDRALQLYREARDRLGEAKALNAIGETSLLSEAAAFHQQALAVASEISSPEEQARALEGLGKYHLNRGERELATEMLLESLSSYRKIASPRGQNVEVMLEDLEGGATSADSPALDNSSNQLSMKACRIRSRTRKRCCGDRGERAFGRLRRDRG